MSAYDWTGWSDWQSLVGIDFHSIPQGPGAYVIATGQPLSRAIGTDPDGFLDIGESVGLSQRLYDFVRCATKRGDEGHMAGWRYAFFHFDRHYPFESLRVRWLETDTKEDAYRAEGRLMLEYLNRHSELPPLNYKFNWKLFEELGWDVLDNIGADS
jgi:hypothetical protein